MVFRIVWFVEKIQIDWKIDSLILRIY
jgi:hypothetical protein